MLKLGFDRKVAQSLSGILATNWYGITKNLHQVKKILL